MARVAVVSDTHGRKLIKLAEIIKENNIDSIVFLGDLYQDGEYLHRFTGLPTINILGNNDTFLINKVANEVVKDVKDYKVFATHGHKYGVKGALDKLTYKAEELGADICLYGHTHKYDHRIINNIHYFNPGSPGLNYSPEVERTFGIMDLRDGINFEKVVL